MVTRESTLSEAPAALHCDEPPGEPPLAWSKWLRYWGTLLVWMVVVSYLSTDAFSADNTNRYMDPILRWLFPHITTRGLVAAHTVVRKSAHLSEYFVLSVLAFWAFRRGRPGWSAAWVVKALLLAAVYAALDETHQIFTMSRTPSPIDSCIDFTGAAIAQLALYSAYRLRHPSPPR